MSIATRPFAVEFARVSKGVGIPYPSFVVISPAVEHPAVVTKEAQQRVEEVVYLLTTDAQQIQDEYRDKWTDDNAEA